MTAHDLVTALQSAGFPVTGIKIIDLDDAATWFLSGDLSEQQHIDAVLLIQNLLHPPGPPPVTKYDLIRRFTPEEYSLVMDAATTDDRLKHGLALFDAADAIAPTDLVAMVGYCVETGLLSAERVDALVAGTVPPT
jgi:hypothetical protein